MAPPPLADLWQSIRGWKRFGAAPRSRPAGLFITHVWSPRIRRHFDRLVEQSGHLVDWRPLYNPWSLEQLLEGHGDIPLRRDDARVREAIDHGRLQMGYMDVLLMPHARAAANEFVWLLEYDVDFSGDWVSLFAQFADNRADLLTTTLNSELRDPAWTFWNSAKAPVDFGDRLRGFLPLARVSKRLLDAYDEAVSSAGWRGHYEFILPTVARSRRLHIEDIGGVGPFTPRRRRGRNYVNVPANHRLGPGTFIWRPSLPDYFHEDPSRFSHADMLYHPVKAGVVEWVDSDAVAEESIVPLPQR